MDTSTKFYPTDTEINNTSNYYHDYEPNRECGNYFDIFMMHFHVIHSVEVSLALVGNICTMFTVFRFNKSTLSNAYILISFLSFVDILASIDLPMEIILDLKIKIPHWAHFCVFSHALDFFAGGGNLLIFTLIAFDRFMQWY